MKNQIIILFLLFFAFFSCEKAIESEAEDCAGVPGGNSICGCTDSAAFNYNSDATYDDGTCQTHIDNGDYYLNFNGTNSNVDLGNIFSLGSYTKAAWVKRNYGFLASNNILSGSGGHALWAPQNQGAKLSSGHNGNYNVVQDVDSLPEAVWTFVAVTYDENDGSGTLTLYKNGNQVSQATGIEPPTEGEQLYIGKFNNGNVWNGSIDEVAIWDKALTTAEIIELANVTTDMNASNDRGGYVSSSNLRGYWKMNEGEGVHLSDASGNGNIGTIDLAVWKTCDECGCMDMEACNYDSTATIDNRTCEYEEGPCETCVDREILANDFDLDGICDDLDEDDDNDNVSDDNDIDPFNNMICSDTDDDGCDDCSSGVYDPLNDGPDDDGDGVCNAYLIPGRTVYIVGSSYNEAGILTACYWENGTRVELPGGAWATDIVVVDGTVYTCGTGEATDACYWINTTRYDLPGSWGEAEAIAVDGDDVYVAGWFDNGSCYWKNGEKINLTTGRESQAFSIGIHNNGSVYVGGYFMNNHHYFLPCFWKNGNNRTTLPVPDGGDGEVYDMVLENGSMRYYTGYIFTSGKLGYVQKASYWRHTTRTTLPLGGSQWDIYGAVGNGITIDDGKVYVAGYTDWYEDTNNPYTTGGSFPQYWKNSNIHDLEGGPLTDFGTGIGHDIKVVDGNVVVVGEATRDTSYYDSETSACYWLNGELFYLTNQNDVPTGQEDWYRGIARGVFIE